MKISRLFFAALSKFNGKPEPEISISTPPFIEEDEIERVSIVNS